MAKVCQNQGWPRSATLGGIQRDFYRFFFENLGGFQTQGDKMAAGRQFIRNFVFKYPFPIILTAKLSLNCLKFSLNAVKSTKLTKMEDKMAENLGGLGFSSF